MILNSFNHRKKSALVQRSTITFVNGVEQSPTWATVATYRILLWDQSSGQAFLSDRFKEEVTAFGAFDLSADILTGDRVTVGSEVFTVIHTDNVGRADEYKLVALKEYDNGTA